MLRASQRRIVEVNRGEHLAQALTRFADRLVNRRLGLRVQLVEDAEPGRDQLIKQPIPGTAESDQHGGIPAEGTGKRLGNCRRAHREVATRKSGEYRLSDR